MTMRCPSYLTSAICGLAYLLCPQLAPGQSAQVVPEVTAIDILLAPDEVMLDRAKAVNERLRADHPPGFALDATHAPHLTVIQRFVRTSELDKVYAAVAKVLRDESPTSWQLNAKGYYDIPVEKLGLAGIVIEPTPNANTLTMPSQTAAASWSSRSRKHHGVAGRLWI